MNNPYQQNPNNMNINQQQQNNQDQNNSNQNEDYNQEYEQEQDPNDPHQDPNYDPNQDYNNQNYQNDQYQDQNGSYNNNYNQSQENKSNKNIPNKKKEKEKPKPKEKLEKKPVKEKKKEEKITMDIINDMKKLKISENSGLKQPSEKSPLSIVFIGHVDHGKSTLCGSLMKEFEQIDSRTLQKFQEEANEHNRDSWWLAQTLDLLEEEKTKGKTVDIGRCSFETSKKAVMVIDAPGHKNQVPNMIQGASQADIGILVISAKDGEFESGFVKDGQTKEHALIAMSVGMKQLIVLVNKMDDKTVDQSETRFNSIVEKTKKGLKANCGWKENQLTFIPASGITGWNLRSKGNKAPWQKGKTFEEIIDDLKIEYGKSEDSLRMPILDKQKDNGLFLWGKIECGTLVKGMNIQIMPLGKKYTIDKIFDHQDSECSWAKSGSHVKCMIKGDNQEIDKGMVICDLIDPITVAEEIEANCKIMEMPEKKPIITVGQTCICHIHSASEEITISEVLYESIKKDGKQFKKKIEQIKAQTNVCLRFKFTNPTCLEKIEKSEYLGRFTLRDGDKTVGIGRIMKYKPLIINNQ